MIQEHEVERFRTFTRQYLRDHNGNMLDLVEAYRELYPEEPVTVHEVITIPDAGLSAGQIEEISRAFAEADSGVYNVNPARYYAGIDPVSSIILPDNVIIYRPEEEPIVPSEPVNTTVTYAPLTEEVWRNAVNEVFGHGDSGPNGQEGEAGIDSPNQENLETLPTWTVDEDEDEEDVEEEDDFDEMVREMNQEIANENTATAPEPIPYTSDELTPEEADLLASATEEALIPTNSRTILVETTTSRFSSAIWYDKIRTQQVVLAGIGGIGSYVAFLLSRLQINQLIMYDPDTIEEVNMAGQLFGRNHLGRSKVSAMTEFMTNMSSFYSYMVFQDRFTVNLGISKDVMICGFDNMEARKEFFGNWLNRVRYFDLIEDKSKCLFIDGRLNAEEFQVFCIRGDDEYNIQRYMNEFLFDDSEVEEVSCSYKQTSFMANMIGSVMVNLFVNHVANQCEPLIDRDLPFFSEYSAETMFFNTVH